MTFLQEALGWRSRKQVQKAGPETKSYTSWPKFFNTTHMRKNVLTLTTQYFLVLFLPIPHNASNWRLFQLVRFLYNLQNKPKGLALALQLLFCFYKLLHYLIISSLEEFLRKVNLKKVFKLNWIYCPIMPFSYPSSLC